MIAANNYNIFAVNLASGHKLKNMKEENINNKKPQLDESEAKSSVELQVIKVFVGGI